MTEQEEKMDPSSLRKLVNRVKACTQLAFMKDSDWTRHDVIPAIEKFVSTNENMICLFYEDDVLKATFSIPDTQTDSVMWFMKNADEPDVRLDNSNFLKLISFGKLDTQVEKTMFLLWDSFYSPFIFSWSSSEKDRFFEQYRIVIQELCSLRYKFLGMPSIYIPPSTVLDITKSVSEETLKVLENIMNVYITEIQMCLMDYGRVPTRCEYMLEHIIDELNFWENRRTHLRFITTLLNYKSVEELLNLLKHHQSILIQPFNKIINKIEDARKEAEFNMRYLEILRQPCMGIYDASSLNVISNVLPDIFMKFFFILEESPYYNKWSDINRLFEYLGNQIVFVCRKSIKLSELFVGNTELVLDKLQLSMECCENYIKLYTEAIKIYNSKSENHWSVETKDVHLFLERCKDVQYICKAMILFKRLNGRDPVPKPEFSFTRGSEFELVIESIETRFDKMINNLESVQNVIFNVNSADWFEHDLKFKNEVNELCEIVEHLLNDAISVTCNAEDALNVLQSLHYFAAWPNLKGHFQKKTNQVYSMLTDDISSAMQHYAGHEYPVSLLMPRYSGVCISSMTEFKRISTLKNLVSDRPWLMACPNDKNFNKMYKRYATSYRGVITHVLRMWIEQIPMDYDKHSERNLIVGNQNEHYWNLTTNLDSFVLDSVNEIEHWTLLGFDIPLYPKSIIANAPNIKLLHRNVSKVVDDYNYLISGLSEQEMLLFSELIETCNKITLPMARSVTWTQLNIENHLTGSYELLESVQNCVDGYKHCNAGIVEICECISFTYLFKTKDMRIQELRDFKKYTETIKNNNIATIWGQFNQIIRFVTVVYELFGNNIHCIQPYLTRYVEKLDGLICEALTLNIRRSLENMLKLLVGDGSGPVPVILVDATLENKQVKFSSSLAQLLTFSTNFTPNLLLTVRPIPRLCHVFKVSELDLKTYSDIISHDQICTQLQEKITLATIKALQQFMRHMSIFRQYEDIWTINKHTFIDKYKKLTPLAEHFHTDMTQYAIYKQSVENIAPVAQVAYFLIRTNALIEAIIEHCDMWRSTFSQLLLEMTTDLIGQFYQYIQINSAHVMKSPENLSEMISFIEIQKKIAREYDDKGNEFTVISNNINILDNYNSQLSESIRSDYGKLFKTWKIYKNTLEDSAIMLKRTHSTFKNALLNQQKNLKNKAKETLQNFLETAPISTDCKSNDALQYIDQLKTTVKIMKTEEKQLSNDLELFGLKYMHSKSLQKLEKEILQLDEVWTIVNKWDSIWKSYKDITITNLQISEVKNAIEPLFEKLNGLSEQLNNKKREVIETTLNFLNKLNQTLPLIEAIKNSPMKNRHWNDVRKIIGQSFDETQTKFTIEKIMELGFYLFYEQIIDVSKKSTVELNIENVLNNIKKIWGSINLNVEPYKDRGIYYVNINEELSQILEDHLVQISEIKGSKFIPLSYNEADGLEKELGLVMETLELTFSVQRQYLYLENIFVGDDIRQRMPIESIDYDILTEEWKEITSNMYRVKNAFNACHSRSLLKQLNTMNYRLEVIQNSLEVYMDTKRRIFPRFYFISNHELIEILGNSKTPELVQPHLHKCFQNIRRVNISTNDFQKKEAQGMFSNDDEYVEWTKPVICEGLAEFWLNSIEIAMRDSLRHAAKYTKTSLKKNFKSYEKWVSNWPGQLCIAACQIQWTNDCTRALLKSKLLGHKHPLKKIYSKHKHALTKLSQSIRRDLTRTTRLKLVSLVAVEIHAKDVIEQLYKSNCTEVSAFEWTSQLRFYWDRKTNDITVKQTHTKHAYGYEYLGNSKRLFITPLTDRCFVALTAAMRSCRGAIISGPTNTGKTETVKDLGKNLARCVIMVDCSGGLDYKTASRVLCGLAQQGAWGCFEGFYRVDAEVLSVVAQHVSSVLSNLAAGSSSMVFGKTHVKLAKTCAVFGTASLGSQKRPDVVAASLKSVFRPVSVVVPDSRVIVEATLFAEGFRDARNLANKIVALHSTCERVLSKQTRYEFGLRATVELLEYAGRLRRQHADVADDEIVELAVRNGFLPMLADRDVPLFMDIKNDFFPDTTLPDLKRDELVDAVKRCMLAGQLQPSKSAVAKVVQLHETKQRRRSVIVVGQTGAAKSRTWKTLQNALTLLNSQKVDGFERVTDYTINPKALTLEELYGKYCTSARVWKDGVVSSVLRKTCLEDGPPEQKWIVFDGPIDAIWTEHLNSVMDNNKQLILSNGERMTIPKQVSFLFEVEDLEAASPTMISRCGVVYNNYKDYGWRLYVDSWLGTCKYNFYKNLIKNNFDHYVENLIKFKKTNCIEALPLPELSCIVSLCKLLECCTFNDLALRIPDGINDTQYELLVKKWFIFSLLWSICGAVDDDSRKKVDTYFREIEGVFPMKDTVYHYYVDSVSCKFKHWEDKIADKTSKYNSEIPFYKIIVPTIDTVRYNHLMEMYLSVKRPILLVGNTGTGKTSTVQYKMNCLSKNNYSFLTINMCSLTLARDVQVAIEDKLEKRTKELYLPQAGKTLVSFLDDIHMPAVEQCGAKPPLELIRQWIDYEFWYDSKNQRVKNIRNMLLVCAMCPSGNKISNRFISGFSVVNVTSPDEAQLSVIFGTILRQHLLDFDESVVALETRLTSMTLDIYHRVVNNMLPTPTKTHYIFNLRDVSKVLQGLLRSNTLYQNVKVSMLRLWCHEVIRVFSDRLTDDNDRKWFMDLINEQLKNNYELTYSSLWASKTNIIFCHFLTGNGLYKEIVDENCLMEFIENSAAEYNSNTDIVPIKIQLFGYFIEHICRVARVISQPRGHKLLVGIGGSGRSSIAKLSTWLCKYGIFTIEISKSYGLSEFNEDLKLLYTEVAVNNKATSFIINDNQIIDESFLKVINNILCTGAFSKLFKKDDFEEIISTVTVDDKQSDSFCTNEEICSYLTNRINNNLHMIISLSPVGKLFRNRLRLFPGLINCTSIDWLWDWPDEALHEVASKSLDNIDLSTKIYGSSESFDASLDIMPQDDLRENIAKVFVNVHQSAIRFSNLMKTETHRHNYIAAIHYLEMVSRYNELFHEKRLENYNLTNKLRNSLQKIDDTSQIVVEMTMELKRVNELAVNYTKECEALSSKMSSQTVEMDAKKKAVDNSKTKLIEEELKCQEIYDVATADLKSAMPELEDATNTVRSLSKKDISEIKSFTEPPEGVKLVLEAVMALKQSDSSWAEVKRQLDDPNFLRQLGDFDKDRVPDNVLEQINSYTTSVEFKPEKVGAQSAVAKSLALWVIAVEKYAKIHSAVTPKLAIADAAMTFIKEKRIALDDTEERLLEKISSLEHLKREYSEKVARKELLLKKVDDLKENMERAVQLIDGLSSERMKWNQTVKLLNVRLNDLTGDCILSSAYLSYMGPFMAKYRNPLMSHWSECTKTMGINCNPDYSVVEFLSKPITIKSWNERGLFDDDLSVNNAIVINQSRRYPLIVDPQYKAWTWIKNTEQENGLKVVDFRMPNHMTILKTALIEGTPTIVRVFSEDIDPVIVSVLSKSILKIGNECFMQIGKTRIPYNDRFRMYIVAKIKTVSFTPEIFSRASVVDFAIQEEGLEQHLLTRLISIGNPALEERKLETEVKIETENKNLADLENELLEILNKSECPLLDNENLFHTIKSSKIAIKTIKDQLANLFVTRTEINTTFQSFRAFAKRATILFFILNDLSEIEPMYQFSLDHYVRLFENSIKESNAVDQLEERINFLNEYHMYAVYKNTCRVLFESHKLLFAFQMCLRILTIENKVNPAELRFLLTCEANRKSDKLDTNKKPDWLPLKCWKDVLALKHLSAFRGIEKSFELCSSKWNQWYTSCNPENLELIGDWNGKCNSLQRMLLIRCLRPDRLSFSIKHFIVDNLGPQFVEPPTMDLKCIMEESKNNIPVMFLLSPGDDPMRILENTAKNYKMKDKLHRLSLGSGQEMIVKNVVKNSQREGHWVFLANCHHLLSWAPLIYQLIESMEDGKAHSDFKLWLSSSSHPNIPISIVQSCLKISIETTKNLKSNLSRLYENINEDQCVRNSPSDKMYKKLLFNLCFFHSIIALRGKYRNLGWNDKYTFSFDDFALSDTMLYHYAEHERPSWMAIRYFIGDIFYGGNVTNCWDKRLLDAYVHQYFDENALTIFRLSSTVELRNPETESFQSHREWISSLPSQDIAQSFGQHTNADVAYSTHESLEICLTLARLQKLQCTTVKLNFEEDHLCSYYIGLLQNLPEPINTDKIIKTNNGLNINLLDAVFVQEVSLYNTLLQEIKAKLIGLEKGIKGLTVITSDQEEMYKCIAEGNVPEQWIKAYPSTMHLGAWLNNLIERVKYFQKWVDTVQLPIVSWLGAFMYPTSFLTSILQIESRNSSEEINSLKWELWSLPHQDLKTQPVKGIYVHKLYLEGAGWDEENICLCEPSYLQLVAELPCVHLVPVVNKKKINDMTYECPVYYCPLRAIMNEKTSFVIALHLPSGQKPQDYWLKRATAILLNLDK
ncbi:dynein axonemal heavy chain 2-like [Adelges cooleyi]|uniref:dynein axonemal heavy chain 2-like n=1 Tax=Adelges cooleyi TaxID=133065 RepID=UPI0021805777|nr:dynein axonemal heavy chain 2-like [Adelges cooleyi]